MRQLTTIFLFFTALVLTSCNREGELKGDVFIVTEGAQNLKLGLVEVKAIPEADMKKFIGEKKKIIAPEVERLQQEYNEIKQQHDLAYKEFRQLSQALSDVEKAMSEDSFGSPSYNNYRSKGDQLVKEMSAKAKVEDDLRKKLKVAEKNLNEAKSPSRYFADMPNPLTTVTTDADGKFVMKLPSRERFALAARASRQVGDSKEEYYWLVWFSLDGESSKTIMLSNNNLLKPEDLIKP